jgi:phosphofructokinase-like protein
MKIGVLTGGGDCPGLNAVVRAIVQKGICKFGFEMFGIHEGWKGLLGEGIIKPLGMSDVAGILKQGGTILKTSRTNPYAIENGVNIINQNMTKHQIDALIVIGGIDTLGAAARLYQDGIKLVGVPKTIDNNIWGTDRTFGFDTAVNVATEAIDRVRTSAESHNRVFVVEVMGRDTGWIALESGIAGGATMILIPEYPVDLEKVVQCVAERHKKGGEFSLIVVAEGTKIKKVVGDPISVTVDDEKDEFGNVRLGGVADKIAEAIRRKTGFDCRSVRLGHIQRGGTPSAADRVLSTRYGLYAVDMVNSGEFGKMAALRGTKIVPVSLVDAMKSVKTVDQELYETAELFFG